jgi:1-acyl-sn-glycerol-3-phosphate acyltransferase
MTRVAQPARTRGALARSWRLARALLLLVRGVLIAAVLLGGADVRRRNRHMQPWCAALLDILGVEVVVRGALPQHDAPVFIAANHVSWLDIWALNAVRPGLFVAKSEIRGWPVVGWLAARVGTLFIERARRTDTRRTNERIVARLAVPGEQVTVFPEGTTTDGSVVRPFHASLLQPAVAAHARVHPLAIRYTGVGGAPSTAAAYIGDMSLAQSMWRIAGAIGLRVELHFQQPIEPGARTRRELAALAQARVTEAIEAAPHAAPDRSA